MKLEQRTRERLQAFKSNTGIYSQDARRERELQAQRAAAWAAREAAEHKNTPLPAAPAPPKRRALSPSECARCGIQLEPLDPHCPRCGTARRQTTNMPNPKRATDETRSSG